MINLSIKYYATEEYVDEAIANLDLSAGVMDSIDILNNVEPNKQLVTNGIGVLEWKDQPLYETNCVVVKLNSTNVIDKGESVTDGRYQYTFSLVDAGCDFSGSTIWDTSMYPWTIYFDGESITIEARRMPVMLQNPTSKITTIHAYQYGDDIRIDVWYNEGGEHIFAVQAGEMKYSQLSYNYMPDGYPKIIHNLIPFGSYSTVGTLSDDGQSYYFQMSYTMTGNTKYRVRLKDADYFVTSVENEGGLVTLGSAAMPYNDPPFYAECDPNTSKTIFYWNVSYGKTKIGISKVEDVLVPMDEKFLPESVALKSDIDAILTGHNHIIDDITDLQAALDSKALQSDLVALANDFSTKADREHNHNDVYYTESEIDTMLSEMASIERGGTGQTSIVDTTYVEPRYRASALVNTETTPTENGVIAWVYE